MTAPPGWRWSLLTDLARLETGHTPSRRIKEYWDGAIPWISTGDVTSNEGRILSDTDEHVSELGIANSAARVLPAGTVCLSRTASIGYVVMIGRPMATSQDFVNWVCGDSLYPRFLKYVLQAERESMSRFASGTTHKTIYFPEVRAFHICHPSSVEQRAIAGVLGALDDRAELLLEENRTLHQVIERWFNERFVRPFYPRAELPRGWRWVTLGEIAALDKGVSYKGDALDEAGMPMVNLGCFRGGGVFDASAVKGYSGDYRARHLVSTGDIVLANTDLTQKRNVLGSPAILPPPPAPWSHYLFSHHVFCLRPNEEWQSRRSFLYLVLLQRRFRERAMGFATGTTVLGLPRDAVLGHEFVVPDDHELARFLDSVEPMVTKQVANEVQASTLGQIRRKLLPRLVSGRVRVEDAERLAEATL